MKSFQFFFYKCDRFSAGRFLGRDIKNTQWWGSISSPQVFSENIQLQLLKLLMTPLVSQKGFLGSSYEGQGTRSNKIISEKRRFLNWSLDKKEGWPCEMHHHYVLLSSPSLPLPSNDREKHDEFCRFVGCKSEKKKKSSFISPSCSFSFQMISVLHMLSLIFKMFYCLLHI